MNYNICWYRQGVILLLFGTDNTYYSYFVPTVFHANPGPTSETIFTPYTHDIIDSRLLLIFMCMDMIYSYVLWSMKSIHHGDATLLSI